MLLESVSSASFPFCPWKVCVSVCACAALLSRNLFCMEWENSQLVFDNFWILFQLIFICHPFYCWFFWDGSLQAIQVDHQWEAMTNTQSSVCFLFRSSSGMLHTPRQGKLSCLSSCYRTGRLDILRWTDPHVCSTHLSLPARWAVKRTAAFLAYLRVYIASVTGKCAERSPRQAATDLALWSSHGRSQNTITEGKHTQIVRRVCGEACVCVCVCELKQGGPTAHGTIWFGSQ